MDRNDRVTVSMISIILALGAFALAFGALFIAGDSSADSTSGSGGVAAATTSNVVKLTLADLKISPAMPEIPAGPTVLEITNTGSQVHNLSVTELNKDSGDIQPGGTVKLDLGTLKEGTYNMACTVPGHAAAGMTGMLHVGASSGATETAGAGSSAAPSDASMTWQQMDASMAAIAKRFPAKTAGHGGDDLAPKVLPDGTKEFDLTARIVDWEVAPGKTVKAWTYNGIVPGPTIKVNVGDKVKVVLTNKLPESTSLHFHGVRVPNAMDGVDPYTQAPIQPGETFTYAFTALEPAVGMYHSHHDAQVQVPNGMAGAFLIGQMPLPKSLASAKVVKTVNMVLNDAGTIGLSLNGKSFPATEPYTLKVGQSMIVNYFNEGLLTHPMHLHQPKGWLIAKDGTPLAEPTPGDTFSVAPGERLTVLYTAVDPGVWAWHCHILNHAEGPQGMFGMVTALMVEK
jgi:FtsP/CotA-like multicopper oxidase with cupredoxin domain